MRKYWIIVNGQPQGPFTANEIKDRADFTPELPVWANDMPDWLTAEKVPELAAFFNVQVKEEVKVEPQPQPRKQTPRKQTPWVQPLTIAKEIDGVKKPKSYIIWNIILIFFGNLICAAIGIIFGMVSNKRWVSGNVEGAQKASNGAAWCIMIGIVLALVSLPFSMLMPSVENLI